MSRFAVVTNKVPVEWPKGKPLVLNDVQYTLDLFELAVQGRADWSLAKLEEMGVYQIHETPVPDGMEVVSHGLEFVNNEVRRTYTYRPVAVVIPPTVTMAQCRLALEEAGLLGSVESAVAASGNRRLQILWEYAGDVRRHAPELADLAQALGLTDEQIDALFVRAKTL